MGLVILSYIITLSLLCMSYLVYRMKCHTRISSSSPESLPRCSIRCLCLITISAICPRIQHTLSSFLKLYHSWQDSITLKQNNNIICFNCTCSVILHLGYSDALALILDYSLEAYHLIWVQIFFVLGKFYC